MRHIESQTLGVLDTDDKMMQTLSSTQLIKMFDPKSIQNKDVSDSKPERPGKMKLRDAREVLEIARLKVLVSEMRERAMKMEVQLSAAREGPNGDGGLHPAEETVIGFVENQEAILDKSIEYLRSRVNELRCDIDEMLLEFSHMSTVEKDLMSAKDTLRGLLEEIKDDAGHTKAQLLLLKRQLGELEEKQEADAQKELEVWRALEKSSALEREMEELKTSNKELMQSTEDLSRELCKALREAENIPHATKDDVVVLQAELSELRAANGELLEKEESLQMSRFNEVEELVYLRWVHACLRHNLDMHKASRCNSEGVADHSNTCSPGLPPPSSRGSSGSSPPINPHARSKSSHTSPQSAHHGVTNDAAWHWSPHTPFPESSSGSPVVKAAMQRDPWAMAQMQSMLTHRSATSDVPISTAAPSSSIVRSSRRSFNRSSSNVSSTSQLSMWSFSKQLSGPQKPHMGNSDWSSGALSSKSHLSIPFQNNNGRRLRRHSASSGISFLDEYLRSTDTIRSPSDKLMSRFSAVLPQYERFSNSELSPMSRELGAACVKKNPSHNLFKEVDMSDRVVAAFQVLSDTAHIKSVQHPTFKDLSRQSSHIHDKSDDKHMPSSMDQCLDGDVERVNDDAKEHTPSSEPQSCQSDASSSTQAEFFYDLVRAIETTKYKSIESVAAFVNWFDRQVDMDKRQFYNVPNCPRDRVDAMRRAVYEYEELVAWELELKSFREDTQSPPEMLLKRMAASLEKAENYVKCFTQARELAIAQFTQLDVPTYWMLDSAMIAKIKGASLKLAEQYMSRMTAVLDTGRDFDTPRDMLLLQAAKFLLQVHNFAGGFDEKTAKAFRLLQAKANLHVPLQ